MAQNLARAVTRLVSTSPFMINILVGVQEYSLSVLPTFAFVLEARQRRGVARGADDIYSPKTSKKRRVTCVIFSSLPSSSGSLALLAASNRAETTPNSLRSACLLGFGFRPDPVTPADLSSLLAMAVPSCVLISRKGLLCLSFPPAPRFCCSKCVISPSHHRRTSKKRRTSTL